MSTCESGLKDIIYIFQRMVLKLLLECIWWSIICQYCL